jgi:hypothetical protein
MDYDYEIFLSYSRKTCVAEWVKERFVPLFRDYLANDLGDEPRIFVDRDEIVPGDVWPERVKNALAKSKCLIAMWSPLYFSSEECCRELAVMYKRNVELGLASTMNPSGIIVPVNIRDGDSFPDLVRKFEWLDCKRFVRSGRCFLDSSLYLEFEEVLQDWTPSVARILDTSHRWREEWLSPEWLDVSFDEFLIRPATIRQPKMA